MKKLIGIFIIIIFSISCDSTSSQDEVIDGSVIDASIDLSVTNSNKEDLLNPSNPNSYDKSKIKILYLLDGKLVPQYNVNLDSPGFFMIYQREDRYVMRVFLNMDAEEKLPETYIQWNENEKDIIKIEYSRTSNSVIKKNIWLNNQTITDYKDYLTLTK